MEKAAIKRRRQQPTLDPKTPTKRAKSGATADTSNPSDLNFTEWTAQVVADYFTGKGFSESVAKAVLGKPDRSLFIECSLDRIFMITLFHFRPQNRGKAFDGSDFRRSC